MKLRKSKSMPNLFETKSHSWAQVGLALQISQDAARKARREIVVLIPAIVGVFVFYHYRDEIFGERYGDASEFRAGFNWYFVKERGLRFNAEWLHLDNCPVGYTAVPYPVGGNGNVFHTNLEMNF